MCLFFNFVNLLNVDLWINILCYLYIVLGILVLWCSGIKFDVWNESIFYNIVI